MARRVLNLRELRAQAEAAEALGLNTPPVRRPRSEPAERRPRPESKARLKVVWNVCDIGGKTVRTFDYAEKAVAEAYAEALKAKGKGKHFVRSEKVPF